MPTYFSFQILVAHQIIGVDPDASRKNAPRQMLPEKCSPKNAPQNKMLPGKNAPRQNALHQNAPRKKMLPEKNAPQEKMLSIKMLPEKKCSPGKNALHQNAPRKKMLPEKKMLPKKNALLEKMLPHELSI